jgi:hypothetical protein
LGRRLLLISLVVVTLLLSVVPPAFALDPCKEFSIFVGSGDLARGQRGTIYYFNNQIQSQCNTQGNAQTQHMDLSSLGNDSFVEIGWHKWHEPLLGDKEKIFTEACAIYPASCQTNGQEDLDSSSHPRPRFGIESLDPSPYNDWGLFDDLSGSGTWTQRDTFFSMPSYVGDPMVEYSIYTQASDQSGMTADMKESSLTVERDTSGSEVWGDWNWSGTFHPTTKVFPDCQDTLTTYEPHTDYDGTTGSWISTAHKTPVAGDCTDTGGIAP